MNGSSRADPQSVLDHVTSLRPLFIDLLHRMTLLESPFGTWSLVNSRTWVSASEKYRATTVAACCLPVPTVGSGTGHAS